MEGRGGCCIANYAAGGHVAAYDTTSKMDVDRIMMRFRPIAPKPAANSNASSDAGDCHAKAASGGRGRRKCTGRRKRKSCSPDQTLAEKADYRYQPSQSSLSCSDSRKALRKNDNPRVWKSHESKCDKKFIVGFPTTLPLLPEAPDLSPHGHQTHHPIWLNFTQKSPSTHTTLPEFDNYNHSHQDRTAVIAPRQSRVVESYLIVEGITDTWTEDDHQSMMMKRRLEEDTCPGLITDAWNHRVWWTNAAYRRMVMGDTWQDQEMAVWVMMREKVPESLQAFTCRVRVQRSNDGEGTRGSKMTLPCDVWRIDGGGWFAWRLDVDAALSLGR